MGDYIANSSEASLVRACGYGSGLRPLSQPLRHNRHALFYSIQELKNLAARDSHIELTEKYSAHNYAPVEVVIAKGHGAWVYDAQGRRYLDMLTSYSALSFGHRHPRLLRAAKTQLGRLTLTSRAFYNDQLGAFAEELVEFCGMEAMLPMNTGAEGVETAIKAVRKWGYEAKGVEPERAEIICFENNFHGRTTTIVGFSSSILSRHNFGPFGSGFVPVAFGDAEAVRQAVTRNTVAVLVEPIQGEAGVIIPPAGFLKELREICSEHHILMVADEIQTGLCRTGEIFACDHEQVKPDVYILGKALGGGIMPLSAVVSRWDVMQVFTPGTHGSTFGGNPLACAVGREVLALIKDEKPELRSKQQGRYLLESLQHQSLTKLAEVRGRGLFIGLDVKPQFGKAKRYCEELKALGVLCKDTHDYTIRVAPSLFISKREIDWAVKRFARVFG